MFGGHGKMFGLFGARDHNNLVDHDNPWLSQQEQQDQQQQMPAGNAGNGMTDLGQLAKIKAELEAAAARENEKPLSTDPAVKRSPKLSARETRAFEPAGAAGGFPAAPYPPSGQQMSPRQLARERGSTDEGGGSVQRSASQKAKKKDRRRSSGAEDDGQSPVRWGSDFPQSHDGFSFGQQQQPQQQSGFAPAPNGFNNGPGAWPDAAAHSPRRMQVAPGPCMPTQSPQRTPPLTNAQRMPEDMLENGVAQRSSGSMSEPGRTASTSTAAPHVQFDEAILAAMSVLPEQSLVDMLRKLTQRRPQAVATAFGPSQASRSRDIQAVVQAGLPTRSDNAVPVLAPPASPKPPAAMAEEVATDSIAAAVSRPPPQAGLSPPQQTFASPRLEEATPMPFQPDGAGPWQSPVSAPLQLSRAVSPLSPGPWGPPVTAVGGGSPWPAAADQSPQGLQAPLQDGSPPPQGSTGQLPGGKPWGAGATISPWG